MPLRSHRPPSARPEPRVRVNPPAHALGRVNAIITTTVVPYLVERFAGPLSIKWMASGWATWHTAGGDYRVDPGCYLVLNHGRPYSLAIDTDEPRESFCAFFAAGFAEDVSRSLTTPSRALLDRPDDACPAGVGLAEHLVPADRSVVPQLRRMHEGFRRGHATDEWLEDQFHVLAERLLLSRDARRREISDVPATRPATREEIHRRLCRARDHMHGSFDHPLPLDAIAREACLAPHHFHRLFRHVFGRTPHEYVTGLRIARARTLLAVTDRSVSEICLDVGFESLGSFSTLFRRETGVSPRAFRDRARRNSQDPRSVRERRTRTLGP